MYKQILFLSLAFVLIAQGVFADVVTVEEDGWSYAFHLQYSNNTLSRDTSASEPYIPIPELYTSTLNPDTTTYYGTVINGKGKEVARFGFDEPKTVVEVLGKSIFDVRAPFYANADHVNFYTKNKKLLFTISVKGSSFCNDNARCNADIGENYLNCSNDCPPPPQPVTPISVTPINTTTPTITPPVQTPSIDATTTESPIVTRDATSSPLTKTHITLIILGIVFLILIFVLWKLRNFSDE